MGHRGSRQASFQQAGREYPETSLDRAAAGRHWFVERSEPTSGETCLDLVGLARLDPPVQMLPQPKLSCPTVTCYPRQPIRNPALHPR